MKEMKISKVPKFAILLCPLTLLQGCQSTGIIGEGSENKLIGSQSNTANTPRPTINPTEYSVKILSDGVVQIHYYHYGPEFGAGPLQALSNVLTQHQNDKFNLTWKTSVASSWSTDKVVYNRRAGFLKFDELGGMGSYQSNVHVLYSQVTDEKLAKAAQEWNVGNQSDAGFLALNKHGCVRTAFGTSE